MTIRCWALASFFLCGLCGTRALATTSEGRLARGAEASRLNRAGFRKADGSPFSRRDLSLSPARVKQLAVDRRAVKKGEAAAERERDEARKHVASFIQKNLVPAHGAASERVEILARSATFVRFKSPRYTGKVGLDGEQAWIKDRITGEVHQFR